MDKTHYFLITVGVIFIVYVGFRYFKRRVLSSSPGGSLPSLTMEQAWAHWMGKAGNLSDADRNLVDMVYEKIDDDGIKTIQNELLEIKEMEHKAKTSLVVLREALMDYVDQYYSCIGYLDLDDENRQKAYPAYWEEWHDKPKIVAATALKCKIMISILRWYSFLKYNDADEEPNEDWFTFYTQVVQNLCESIKRFFQSTDDGPGSMKWVHANISKSYLENKKKLKTICINAPPRTKLSSGEMGGL